MNYNGIKLRMLIFWGQKFTFGEESQKEAIMKKETWNTTFRKHNFQENSKNKFDDCANFT